MAYRIVRVSSRCKLETQLNYLVCRGDKEIRILLDEISVLIVENTQVCLTASLVSELLSHKTRIVFCDNSHNPQGEVAPYEGCFDASSKLRTQQAWSRERMDFVWKQIVEETGKIRLNAKCTACPLRHLCRTCAASALLETGSYEGVPDYMCRYAEESLRLLREEWEKIKHGQEV